MLMPTPTPMPQPIDPSAPKTLHIIGSRKSGGAERFFLRLAGALSQRAETASLTARGSDLNAALTPGLNRFHAPLAGVWDLWSRWRIRQTVKRFQPDIVQTYMGRATRLTHLPKGKKPVHVARLGGYYNLKGYRHAHAWVGNTRGICDYLVQQGLPAERVFHIGNFVDIPPRLSADELARQRQALGIPATARVVLGLGRLHPNKGFADLLDAFARLPGELDGQPLLLLMVGDGPLRDSLKRQADTLAIGDRVIWAGWRDDPAASYQMADLFVCSSRHEPLGNVVLEAWANRTLVVSTRSEGPLEMLEDGVDGLFADKADALDLARAIQLGLTLPATARDDMVAAGYRKLETNFSEAAIVAAYQALYRKLTQA